MRSLLVLFGSLMWAQFCPAFTLWSVDRLDMEYYKYREGFRDPYLLDTTDDGQYVPMQLTDGAELHMDVQMLRYTYWRNRFHMAEDSHKHVRHVGWEWEGGVDVSLLTGRRFPIEIYEHHHSQHGLEYINPRGDRFPVEDTYGIRFKLIESTRSSN